MDKENMKPKLKQRKKSYRKFCDRRKNDVRNHVADGKKMMATKYTLYMPFCSRQIHHRPTTLY